MSEYTNCTRLENCARLHEKGAQIANINREKIYDNVETFRIRISFTIKTKAMFVNVDQMTDLNLPAEQKNAKKRKKSRNDQQKFISIWFFRFICSFFRFIWQSEKKEYHNLII